MDAATLIDKYELVQERVGRKESTRQIRRTMLTALARDVDLNTVTAEEIEQWIDARHVSLRTRKTYLCLFAPFFRWMVKAGYRTEDPVLEIERPRLAKLLPRPIVTSDLAYALQVAPPRMRAWLTLGALQGMRCMEIAGLRREGVDEAGAELRLLGKGDKERRIPLNPTTLAALKTAGMPRSGFVFLNAGAPYTPSEVSRLVSQYFNALGMQWTAHNLRHWFGTAAHRKTRDLRLVQELMGHDDPKTTAGYVDLTPAEAEAIRGLVVDAGGGEAVLDVDEEPPPAA